MGCTQAVQSIRKSTGFQHPIEAKKMIGYVSLGKLNGKQLCLAVMSYAYKRTKARFIMHQVNLRWRDLLFKDKPLIKQFLPSDKSIKVNNNFKDFSSQVSRSVYGDKKLVFELHFLEKTLNNLEIVDYVRYHTVQMDRSMYLRPKYISEKQIRLLEWYKFKRIKFLWDPSEQIEKLAVVLHRVAQKVPSIHQVDFTGGYSENDYWKEDDRVPTIHYKLKGKRQIANFIKIFKGNEATESEFQLVSEDEKVNIKRLLQSQVSKGLMKVKYVTKSVYTDQDYDFQRDNFPKYKIRADLFWTFSPQSDQSTLPTVLKQTFHSLLTTKSKMKGGCQIQIDDLLRIIIKRGNQSGLYEAIYYRQLYIERQTKGEKIENILNGISKISEVPILQHSYVRELVICRAQRHSAFLLTVLIKMFSKSLNSLRFTSTRPPGRLIPDRNEHASSRIRIKFQEPQEYKFEAEFGFRLITLPKLSKLEIELCTIDDLGHINLYTNLLNIAYESISDLNVCIESTIHDRMNLQENSNALYELKDAVGRLKNMRRLSVNLFAFILFQGRLVANPNYQQLTFLSIYGQEQITHYQEERIRRFFRKNLQNEYLDSEFSDNNFDLDYDPGLVQTVAVDTFKKFFPQLAELRILKIDYTFLNAIFSEQQFPNLKKIIIVANEGLNRTKEIVHEIAWTRPPGFKFTIIAREGRGKLYAGDYIRQFYEINPNKKLKIKFQYMANFIQ
ncbi:hypothetical protein FGO68_gene9684 [Halteria grandinella]|uniref:Uncharacterized protein n=1 Tax=Halteria grandinella TaxID=5974 RepID=A0A8J8NY73_HALGN|nr:hypothetical protein FGO68_gene9684 [Halteria grandinella]